MLAVLATACALALPAAAVGATEDVNPSQSSADASDPRSASGGRVNGLAAVPGDNQTFYAATEWGGLYKSGDGGLSWTYLVRHYPTVTWDVEVSPSDASRVIATSFYDGRVDTLAGINVSTDGGATWTHPPQPPPAAFCTPTQRFELSAFGIAFDPDALSNVYVGTGCGLAISTNSGASWSYVDPDPTPDASAVRIWDVIVHDGGIIDVCGDEGHRRSTDGGASWSASTGLFSGPPGRPPMARCSIAVSPDESYVLFVADMDNRVYELDSANSPTATWTLLGSPEFPSQGRIPFVQSNERSGGAFDLWFGDVDLYRAGCTTPVAPAPGGSPRCPAPSSWTGGLTNLAGAHPDVGDIVFNTEAASDACPVLFSSDGGIYYNTDTGVDCQNPNWEQPNTTPHALWLFALDGADAAGDGPENLYLSTQDNGLFVSQDAGAGVPAWTGITCCDVFDVVADPTRVVFSFFGGGTIALNQGPPNALGTSAVNLPSGNVPTFNMPDFVDQFGPNQYVVVTAQGAFTTNDITASPVVWTQLGAASTPVGGFCAVQASTDGLTTRFYAQTTCPTSWNATTSTVWRYDGTAPGGTWTRIDDNDGLTGGFHVFGVDPSDPDRVYAARGAGAAVGQRIVFSNNGGATWDFDSELESLMTGGDVSTGDNAFNYRSATGPTNFTSFNGYLQPSLFAYDPNDPNVIVAGGRDSGVFLSTDAGANWSLVTDPLDPATSGLAHLPRPYFAYFDDEPAGEFVVFIGTQGRGVWRIRITLPIADAGGPYNTVEGTGVALDGAGSTDPDGGGLTYEWDLDGDGTFGEAGETGVSPTFSRVGRDGVFGVCLKVTDPEGGFDIACTTVTVANVAPSVSFNPATSVPENSAATVAGAVTDPGWLDPLTATIDWDGAGPGLPEPLAGVLEQNPPDATLTFSAQHTYGDDGMFMVTVCAADDDTSNNCSSTAVTVSNVNPTADIETSGATVINGVPTFVAHAGDAVPFSGRATDPGSDDLLLSWSWGDGLPFWDVTTSYPNDPANVPDPDPSPTINPRDVTDSRSHTFGDACLYEVAFRAEDDDLGVSPNDTAAVVIAGNALVLREAGYWQTQYRPRPSAFPEAQRLCYLAIVRYVSQLFGPGDPVALDTAAQAFEVLFVGATGGSALQQLDRQIITAWLNFANGAFEFGELVDTNGDGSPDTAFSAVLASAEAVRLNPSSSDAELRAQKDLLERINRGPA